MVQENGQLHLCKTRLDSIAKSDIDEDSDPRSVQGGCRLDAEAAVFLLVANAVNSQSLDIEGNGIVGRHRANFAKDAEEGIRFGIAEAKQIKVARRATDRAAGCVPLPVSTGEP
jgi:hypothetical protein